MDQINTLRMQLVVNKQELLGYADAIQDLFLNSFGSVLNKEVWHWAYIDNVNGDPLVALCFDEDRLVGHYAVVPMKLMQGSSPIKALLSMTTMVHVDYRRYGVFAQLAEMVYAEAIRQGFHLVYGFPNKNSAPGFQRRLGWTLCDQVFVAKLEQRDLFSVLKKDVVEPEITLDYESDAFLQWRLKKPDAVYHQEDKGIVLKSFGTSFDIVAHQYDFTNLPDNMYYHVLISGDEKHLAKKAFDYIFGYKIFDKSMLNVSFDPCLLMSDVF